VIDEIRRTEAVAGMARIQAMGGPAFASALAVAAPCANAGTDETRSTREAVREQTMELARSGGGAARITLTLASGETADIRVHVRDGRVTVLAQVSSPRAEDAIRAAEETIARSLRQAGLSLGRLTVKYDRAATRRRGRDDREEQEP
jgi:hypothetical protein